MRHSIAPAAWVTLRARRRVSSGTDGSSETALASRRSVASQSHEL